MDETSRPPRPLLGCEVQYFRLDPRVWSVVLDHARELGYNYVSSYVPWRHHEIRTGKYDFEGDTCESRNLVRFLELISQRNLLFAYRPGPFCCNEDEGGGLPDRVILDHPDISVWDWQNRPAQGYWGARSIGSQPSYLHPKYLDMIRDWFGAADEAVKPFLRRDGGPVTLVNLDNEVSYIVRDSMFGSDYNPLNLQRYARWLEERYRSVSGLPYTDRFTCFEQVEPPRRLGENIEKNLAWYTDWIEFKEDTFREYLSVLRRVHQENGLGELLCYTNLNPHRPEGVPADPAKMQEGCGGFPCGYDFYRDPFLSYSGYSSLARVSRWLSSGGSFAWSAEFMAGYWYPNPGKQWLTPEHFLFMGRAGIANGLKGLFHFMFHDRITWGWAPVSAHGHLRSHGKAFRKLNAFVSRFDGLEGFRLQSPVAVLYDRGAHYHTYIGDQWPCNDSNLHVGEPHIQREPAGRASIEFEGIFRVLGQAGFPPLCLNPEGDLLSVAETPVIWWPTGPITTQTAVDRISEFIVSGGTVVLGPVVPSLRLTGETVSADWLLKSVSREQQFDHLNESWREHNLIWRHGLNRPVGEECWTSFGLPHVYVRSHGPGKIVYLGGHVGQSSPCEEPLGVVALVQDLFNRLGIQPPVLWEELDGPAMVTGKDKDGGLCFVSEYHRFTEVLVHIREDESLLFSLNLHEVPRRVRISVPGVEAASWNEIQPDSGAPPIAPDESMGHSFLVDLDAKSCRIFHAEAKNDEDSH